MPCRGPDETGSSPAKATVWIFAHSDATTRTAARSELGKFHADDRTTWPSSARCVFVSKIAHYSWSHNCTFELPRIAGDPEGVRSRVDPTGTSPTTTTMLGTGVIDWLLLVAIIVSLGSIHERRPHGLSHSTPAVHPMMPVENPVAVKLHKDSATT